LALVSEWPKLFAKEKLVYYTMHVTFSTEEGFLAGHFPALLGIFSSSSSTSQAHWRCKVDPRALFGISILMSSVSSSIIAALYVRPWLRAMEHRRALVAPTAPHMFLRFIEFTFLVTGVVSPSLPANQIVDPAVAAGHDITAVVRNPNKLNGRNPNKLNGRI
jgi:hypothetical protein